jgi:hypothetical protein
MLQPNSERPQRAAIRVRKQRHTATPAKRHVMFGMRPTIACRSEWHRVEALPLQRLIVSGV